LIHFYRLGLNRKIDEAFRNKIFEILKKIFRPVVTSAPDILASSSHSPLGLQNLGFVLLTYLRLETAIPISRRLFLHQSIKLREMKHLKVCFYKKHFDIQNF